MGFIKADQQHSAKVQINNLYFFYDGLNGTDCNFVGHTLMNWQKIVVETFTFKRLIRSTFILYIAPPPTLEAGL